jgi:hypothetical protein
MVAETSSKYKPTKTINKIHFFGGVYIFQLMAMEHYGMSDSFKLFIDIGDGVFVAIFTMEAVLKILGYTFEFYIDDAWNKFDFFIVIIG